MKELRGRPPTRKSPSRTLADDRCRHNLHVPITPRVALFPKRVGEVNKHIAHSAFDLEVFVADTANITNIRQTKCPE